MRTYLHIGTEKTGTTTLQDLLALNRARLKEQRVAVTTSCGRGNNRDLAAYAFRDDSFNDDHLIALGVRTSEDKLIFKRGVEERFSRELTGLRGECDRLVITSEHFQSRLKTEAEVRVLRELLVAQGLQVAKVIVYLRRPVDILTSLYSTALRRGSQAPPPTAPHDAHWNDICDHRKTLELWSTVFGEEALSPRLYEVAAFVGGDLIADFCAAAEIELHGLLIPPNRNLALSPHGQSLMRFMNRHFPVGSTGAARSVRGRLVPAIASRFAGVPSRPSAEFTALCETRFADSNEWVRRRYFPDRAHLFEPPTDA